MFQQKFKRFIALIAVVLGVCFTVSALLSIWEVPGFSLLNQSPMQKLIPTLGILTAAGLALLAVIAMTQNKK